jgi:hypothetical protein
VLVSNTTTIAASVSEGLYNKRVRFQRGENSYIFILSFQRTTKKFVVSTGLELESSLAHPQPTLHLVFY